MLDCRVTAARLARLFVRIRRLWQLPKTTTYGSMEISVFGLGYVGTVCMACFVSQKHAVIGRHESGQIPCAIRVTVMSCVGSPRIEHGMLN